VPFAVSFKSAGQAVAPLPEVRQVMLTLPYDYRCQRDGR
jgi:hypothetical protein